MDSKQKMVVVFITSPSEEEARSITEMLLQERLVACVNAVRDIHSRFWWHGKIDTADEVLLIAKTRESLLPRLTDAVKRIHSYEVPEILALPIVGGNPDYLKWMADETSG